jgi:hypothetical protein
MSLSDIHVNYAVFDALIPSVHLFVIRLLIVESLRKTSNFPHYVTSTQRILIRSQIEEWEVKDHQNLHVIQIYHMVI